MNYYVNKDKKPIYYNSSEEMDKPLSELMEELRKEISKTRGKLSDLKNSFGFKDHIELIEGGLTCMLVAMYSSVEEFQKLEYKQNAKV